MKTRAILGIIMPLIFITALAGCKNKEEGREITDYKEYTITVASEKVTGLVSSCGNSYVTEVYAVMKEHSAKWEQLPSIEGFDYEPGYEYTIRISETSYLDYSMGEPAWTEYRLIETISKEKKASEGVPDSFVPDWSHEGYFAKIDARFRYYVDADNKAAIEEDINSNPMVTFNGLHCHIDRGWTQWFLLDDYENIAMKGFIKKKDKEPADFPETYKNLEPDGTVMGYMEWSFIIGNNPEDEGNVIKYDVFLCSPTRSKSVGPALVPWFYKDLTQYYNEKYPEAGVRTVVVRHNID